MFARIELLAFCLVLVATLAGTECAAGCEIRVEDTLTQLRSPEYCEDATDDLEAAFAQDPVQSLEPLPIQTSSPGEVARLINSNDPDGSIATPADSLDVRQALELLGLERGIVIWISPNASGMIHINLEQIPPGARLDAVISLAKLTYEIDSGIGFVFSNEEFGKLNEVAAGESIKSGDRVVTQGQVPINFGDDTVDDGQKFRVYQVVKIVGEGQAFVQDLSDGVRGTVETARLFLRDQAIKRFTALLDTSKNQSVAYAARGNMWYALGEYDIAISDYDEATRLDPKNAIAFNNRGYCWWKKKMYDKALADYDQAIRNQPDFGAAYNNRSWLLATAPGAKDQDVIRAVMTAHVWKPNGRVELELVNALARASAGSNSLMEIRAWIERLDQTEASRHFLAQLDQYERPRPQPK